MTDGIRPTSRRAFLGTVAMGGGSALLARARPAAAQAAKPAGRLELKFSHATSQDTSLGRAATPFAKRVAELTQGQATVQVFHAGTLATDAQAIEGLQTGTLDIGVITIYTNAVKAGAVFDLPYLFRDIDHWKKAMMGRPGQMVAEAAPATGMRVLGYWLGGWRNVYGQRAIHTKDDFKGLKIRTLQTPTYVEFFKAVGAIPTPMAWPEVYLALQQRTVDAGETALPSMWDAKHYEVVKHVALTQHGLSTVAMLASEQRWKTYPPDIQAAIVKAAKEATDQQHRNYLEDEAKVVEQLKGKGLAVTTPNPVPFREIAKATVYGKLVTDPAQKAILEEVLKL